jgi:hypothetical protein
MSERQLILKDAQIVRLSKYPGADGTTFVLAIRALLTRTLANQLKCHDLCFAENGMPRQFGQLKLNELIENCEVVIGVDTLMADSASHFNIARPKKASEHNASLEVSLNLHFPGRAPLDAWVDSVNKNQFEMSVKPPADWDAQQNLFEKADPDVQDEADEDGEANCVDCANEIPFQDGSTTVHASGQPCSKVAVEVAPVSKEKGIPALAPARELGGTHQRKTRTPRNPAREAEADGSGPNIGIN